MRWQRGDRSAFEALVNLWERPLFYYLRRLAPSEADAWDILQETWLKVFRALGSLRDPHTLPAFLYKTARNTAIDRLRRPEFLEGDTAADQLPDTRPDPFTNFEDAQQVHHALEQLPLLQCEALTLYFLQDMSLDEMATLLEVPTGTVKSRLHYAKIAMKKILTQGEEDAR